MTIATIAITQRIASERAALLALAVETGLFTPENAEALLGGILDADAAGSLATGHTVQVARASDEGAPLGWTYIAPDAHAEGVWNLWWIGVHPAHHGAGIGAALLDHAEAIARAAGGRLLIIETSALPPLERARRVYTRAGYMHCGTIPDFYAVGDAKLTYAKALTPVRAHSPLAPTVR